jgi:hypothetical protein
MEPDHSNYSKGRLIFTKKADVSFTDDFKQRIIEVFKFFPELHNEIVLVGWIAPRGWARGSCWCYGASTNTPLKISLQPNERHMSLHICFKQEKKKNFKYQVVKELAMYGR